MIDWWMRAVLFALLAWHGLAADMAMASDSPPANPFVAADFLSLSFSGDGRTPTALEMWESQTRSASVGKHATGASQSGDASYNLPLSLPPAPMVPDLALAYNSSSGSASSVGRGWSLQTGVTIEKAVGPLRHLTYQGQEVYFVQGMGLSGTLVADGADWDWHSNTPVPLSAELIGDAWTLRSQGRTFTLRALGSGPSPRSWVTSSAQDASGNRVDWIWSGPRLQSIEYGQNDADNPNPVAKVVIDHVLRSYESLDATSGSVLAHDRHVRRIRIFGDADGSGDPTEVSIYELDYEEILGEHLLSSVWITDVTTGDEVCRACSPQCGSTTLMGAGCETCPVGERVLIAEFEYGGWEPASTRVAPELGVPHLGSAWTKAQGQQAYTDSRGMLLDSSGDGLADLVEKLDGTWTVTASWQLLDFAGERPESVFEPSQERQVLDAQDQTIGGIDRTETVLCNDTLTATFGVKLARDFDGDGFVDLISAVSESPQPWMEGDLDWCQSRDYGSPSEENIIWTWRISYGEPGGFGPEEMVLAPFPFPRVSQRPRAPDTEDICGTGLCTADQVEQHLLELTGAGQNVREIDDATVDLHDMDGDGFLDVVHVPAPGVMDVHLFQPDSGFFAPPVSWGSLPWSATATGHSAGDLTFEDWVIVDYEGMDDNFAPDTGLVVYDGAKSAGLMLGEIRGESRMVDLNGDGLVDYVQAEGDGDWSVWLNTGSTFVQRDWAAPVGFDFMSRSVEGKSWVHSCIIADPPAGLANAEFLTAECLEGSCPVDAFVAFMGFGRGDWVQGINLGVLSCSRRGGDPRELLVDLLDVDLDGRLDLVDAASHVWYRNLGSRFSESISLPSIFDGAISRSRTRQLLLGDSDLLQATNGGEAEVYQNYLTQSEQQVLEWSRVMDLDNDGWLDRVQIRESATPDDWMNLWYDPSDLGSLVHYGHGTRETLLTQVTLGTGATTELSYQPASHVFPAGEPDELHEWSARRHLVDSVETTDPTTGQASMSTYGYWRGRCLPGKCLGFEHVDHEVFAYDPAMSAPGTWTWLSKTGQEFELDRDYQQVVETTIRTPAGNPWQGAPTASVMRASVSTTHELVPDLVSVPVGEDFEPVRASWPSERRILDYGDGGGTPVESSVFIERDLYGNVVEVRRQDPLDLRNDVRTTVSWIGNASSDHFVPSVQQTYAWDWVSDTGDALVERGEFAYDGLPHGTLGATGLLTGQVVSAGRADVGGIAAETISWSFERDPVRGHVTAIDAPGARRTEMRGFAFGGAIPTTTAQVLATGDHVSEIEVDDFGRTTAAWDPNGVKTRSEFDGVGRVVRSWVQGVGGPELLAKEVDYDTCDMTHASRETSWTYASDDLAGSSATTHAFLDGWGEAATVWTPNDIGAWLVAETVRDATGEVVREGVPFTTSAAPDPTVHAQEFSTWIERDGMGVERVQWYEFTAGGGQVTTTVPEPGLTVTVDSAGYETHTRTDAFGRVVQVDEGRNGVVQQTGSFHYDGRGRIALFEDANGNGYRYAWDGAGRMRQSWRAAASDVNASPTPSGCPEPDTGLGGLTPMCATYPGSTGWTDWQPYTALEYDGPKPVQLFEGDASTGLLTAQWSWDEIGRNVTHDVLDRGPNNDWLSYSWDWDVDPLDPSKVWYGVAFRIADPYGEVTNAYEPGAFGSRGEISRTERFWSSSSYLAAFDYEYDFRGEVERAGMPGGVAVEHSRDDAGWLLGSKVLTDLDDPAGPTTLLDMANLYDGFGLDAGFVATVPGKPSQDLDVQRNSPARIARATWSVGGTVARDVIYGYASNGLLASKTISGLEPLLYAYDDLGRATAMWPLGGAMLEQFAYDAAGNPTYAMHQGKGDWLYDQSYDYGDIPVRSNTLNGDLDIYGYDTHSRITQWNTGPAGSTKFQRLLRYDGLGRLDLLRFKPVGQPIEQVAYGYDAGNTLVEESHVDGVIVDRILRFQGLRYDTATGQTTLNVLPGVRLVDGLPKLVLHDVDGSALSVFDDSGYEETFDVNGVYGDRFDAGPALPWFQGQDWQLDGLHGANAVDRELGLVHRGQRHAMLGDGRWLQPEPLLGLWITDPAPRALTGVYAAGNPIALQDGDGFTVTPADAVLFGVDAGIFHYEANNWATAVGEFAAAPSAERYGTAFGHGVTTGVTGVGLVASVVAPGGGANPALARASGFLTSGLGRLGRAVDGLLVSGMRNACFTEGTLVSTPAGGRPIEVHRVGDLVLAAASTDGGEEAWVEVDTAPLRKRGAWAPRAFVMACAALSGGCDVAEMPAGHEVVQVHDAWTGEWSQEVGTELQVGDTFVDGGRVLRVTEEGVEVRGRATVGDLADADAIWVAGAAHRLPSGEDWVLVLGNSDDAGHWLLSKVEPGERLAFQGRVFETADADADGDLELRTTDLVLSRVVQTFVRQSDMVIDAEIQYEDGTVEVITGTPEHPFYVPAVKGWMALGELAEGTELHVDSGAGAMLVGKTWRQGDFTVYNFEVENQHNYFVRASGSEAGAVLVHNTCFAGIKWKGFSSGQLREHFQKHVVRQGEFGEITQAEYLKQAKEFAGEIGEGFMEGTVGNIKVKYDPATGRVIVGHAKKREIRTFYIDDGRDADPFQAAMDLAAELTGNAAN